MTLIELMIVVVVIGTLAAVALIAYRRVTNKARSAEVQDMFGKLQVAETNHHAEFGVYVDTGAFFPADADLKGSEATPLGTLPAAWTRLKVNPGRGALYCQYRAYAGAAGSLTAMDQLGKDIYGNVAPLTNWFYLVARCDFDNDGTFSVYAMRHDRSQVYRENEGE